MRAAAWFFSVLLHPLILLNAGIALLIIYHPFYNSKYYDEQLVTYIIYMLVNSIVMPLLVLLLLKRFKFLDTLIISDHKQRTYPYLIITVLLGITAYTLYKNEMGGLPLHFLIATCICLFLNALITRKFGISSHTIAAGGLLALLLFTTVVQHIGQLEIWLVLSVLIAGISGTSRLILQAHTAQQIYWGYLLGFGVVMGTLVILNWGILDF